MGTLYFIIEDLDYADDLASYHTHTHAPPRKTERLQHFGQQTGLEINNNKTKVMPINANEPIEIIIEEEVLDNTDNFTYLQTTTNLEIQSSINSPDNCLSQ